MLGRHKESAAERATRHADAVDILAADISRSTVYTADDDGVEFFEFADAHDEQVQPIGPAKCPFQSTAPLDTPKQAAGLRPWQTLATVPPPNLFAGRVPLLSPQYYMPQSHATGPIACAKDYAEAQVVEEVGTDAVTEDMDALAQTARDILSSLDVQDDPMLQRSRFVAYLRELAGVSDAQTSVSGAIPRAEAAQDIADEDREWEATDKPWHKYEATGFGYARYAREKYPLRAFEPPSDTEISRAEAVVQARPDSSDAWLALGLAHQAGEMDALAIPALYRATDIAPGDAQAWLALASSLANESCIPDALDALRNLVRAYLAHAHESSRGSHNDPRVRAMESNDPHVVVDALERAFPDACATMLAGPRRAISLAATIAYSLARLHTRAVALLNSESSLDNLAWAEMNRLGATFANAGDYVRALEAYAKVESVHGPCARVAYNRGIALLCSERTHEALAAFVSAIRMQDPRYVANSLVWDALGVAAELCGDTIVSAFASAKDLSGLMALDALHIPSLYQH